MLGEPREGLAKREHELRVRTPMCEGEELLDHMAVRMAGRSIDGCFNQPTVACGHYDEAGSTNIDNHPSAPKRGHLRSQRSGIIVH